MDQNIPLVEPSDLNKMKERLRGFPGGRIILTQDEQSGIAYLLLDHTEKKNSMSGRMMADLHDAIEKLENWKTGKGLILHSNGDLFCSGAYLNSVYNLKEKQDGFDMSCLMHNSITRMLNLPLVSVSVVQGRAIGGGAELLVSTDFCLITRSTEISFVQGTLGLTTGWGGGTNLQKLVGRKKALEYLLTARTIGAEEALKVGLADGIVQEESRLSEAVAWLKTKIDVLTTPAVRANKLNVARNNHLQERLLFGSVWANDEQQKIFLKFTAPKTKKP